MDDSQSAFIQAISELAASQGKTTITVRITLDGPVDFPYPLMGEEGAEVLPNGDHEPIEEDPRTYLYHIDRSDGSVETFVVYWLPADYDVIILHDWAASLQSDPAFGGHIKKVTVEPFTKTAGN